MLSKPDMTGKIRPTRQKDKQMERALKQTLKLYKSTITDMATMKQKLNRVWTKIRWRNPDSQTSRNDGCWWWRPTLIWPHSHASFGSTYGVTCCWLSTGPGKPTDSSNLQYSLMPANRFSQYRLQVRTRARLEESVALNFADKILPS